MALTFLKELMLIKQCIKRVLYLLLLVFPKYRFRFQQNACNRCHDLLIMSMNLSVISILNIKGSNYCCIIGLISKNEAINPMKNANLTEKNETL